MVWLVGKVERKQQDNTNGNNNANDNNRDGHDNSNGSGNANNRNGHDMCQLMKEDLREEKTRDLVCE